MIHVSTHSSKDRPTVWSRSLRTSPYGVIIVSKWTTLKSRFTFNKVIQMSRMNETHGVWLSRLDYACNACCRLVQRTRWTDDRQTYVCNAILYVLRRLNTWCCVSKWLKVSPTTDKLCLVFNTFSSLFVIFMINVIMIWTNDLVTFLTPSSIQTISTEVHFILTVGPFFLLLAVFLQFVVGKNHYIVKIN